MLLNVNATISVDERDVAREMEENPSSAAEFFYELIKCDPEAVASCFSADLMGKLEEFVSRMKATR